MSESSSTINPAAERGDQDEAEFWRKALDTWIQARQKKLVESWAYYG